MGGNALKNCTTRRYDIAEYRVLTVNTLCKLIDMFPDCKCIDIPAYNSKESYGDLDILITSEGLPSNWLEIIEQGFKPKEMVKNGNCLSFERYELQVDLIVTPLKEYYSSLQYFSYNDLGNLVGRIAHSLGCKLGHDGLSYNFRIETYQFRNVVLLTDWKDILPVLGLSWERYEQGFETLEDIFKFVVSSPFFNKDIYHLHNRNHAAKTRDQKRKTYTDFLVWIEGYEHNIDQDLNRDILQCIKEGEATKDCRLPYLFKMIPGFEQTYTEVKTEWDAEIKFKQLYNGDTVKIITGLSERPLGDFMKWMMEEVGGDKIKHTILTMNSENIESWITYWHKKYLRTGMKKVSVAEVIGKPHYEPGFGWCIYVMYQDGILLSGRMITELASEQTAKDIKEGYEFLV